MFQSLLGGKFSKKCKYCIRCIKSRIQLIKKKKQATIKFLKKDVADLLVNGHDSNAFGRIDGLTVEINRASCYDMIEDCCQYILNELKVLKKQRECPQEAMPVVSTLIYAAARFSDLPELCDLRGVFTERYGSEMESFVNVQFVENYNKKSFSTNRKLQLMQDIAEEFSVRWDSKAFQQKISNHSAHPVDHPKRSSSYIAAGNQLKESVYDASRQVNNWNKASFSAVGSANSRKESVFNVQIPVVAKKEAIINVGGAVNGRNGAILNAGGSANARKELVQDAEHIKVNRRTEMDINLAKKRNEAVFSEGGDPDISSKGRWDTFHPPKGTSVQKQQVQPEPKDIHVVPVERTRKVSSVTAVETENVDPGYGRSEGRWHLKLEGSQNGVQKDDWLKSKAAQNEGHKDNLLKEGAARNKSPISLEGPGLIGLERQPDTPVISRDVKAASMIPPYTILRGMKNVRNVADCMVLNDNGLPGAEKVSDSPILERRPTYPVSSKDVRPMNMIPPPYTKPNLKKSSSVADEAIHGGDRDKPISVRSRKHMVAETVTDTEPMNQCPKGQRKEGRQVNGDLYAEDMEDRFPRKAGAEDIVDRFHRKAAEDIVDQFPRKEAAEDMNGDAGHDRRARETSRGQRRAGDRRRNATYDGDRDEEEKAMDRLLAHYSKKGMDTAPSKRSTRTRALLAEPLVYIGRDEEHHGNGRSYHPQRVASLPSEPTAPIPKIGVNTRPVRATSVQPDMLSPNGGGMHTRLPDYDDLAARFIALKKA